MLRKEIIMSKMLMCVIMEHFKTNKKDDPVVLIVKKITGTMYLQVNIWRVSF